MKKRELPKNSTPIVNSILEKLARVKLTQCEFNIVFALIRKTYGWDKKADWISLSQFENMTGIKSHNCCKYLKGLVKKKVLIKKNGEYGLNKEVSKWIVSERIVLSEQIVSKQITGTIQTDSLPLSKLIDTKETITKETIQKKGYGEFKNVKLSDIEYQKLIDDYGEQLVKSTIETMSSWLKAKGKTYKDYYAALLNWLKKENKEQPKKTWQDELQANLERSYQEAQKNNLI